MNFVAPGQSQDPLAMIVSGGQTGVDRAALDWAMETGIPHGGWCPRGRRAEDGVIPVRYQLHETQDSRYAQRTEWNVRDSDGTAIFTVDSRMRGGTKRTWEFARDYRKPWIHLDRTIPIEESAARLLDFLVEHHVAVLNVAGSRESQESGIGDFVRKVLTNVRVQLEAVRTVDAV